MSLNIGDKAPAFTLKNSKLEDVSLADFKGRNVLLIFFPLAFTSVCTEELGHLRDNYSRYNDMETEVVALSVDSPFALAKYKEAYAFNFSLLSDFNKEVSRAYNAYYEDFALGLRGVSKRAAFIVGKDGTVKYCEVLENAGNLPNFESINSTLSHLQ